MEYEVSKEDNSLKWGKIMYVYVRVDFIVLSDLWLQHWVANENDSTYLTVEYCLVS